MCRFAEIFLFEYECEPESKQFPSSKIFDPKELTIGSVFIALDQYGNNH